MTDKSTYRETGIPTNSFEAIHWILSNSGKKLSTDARHLALQLAHYWNMDGKGTCNPSILRLREDTGMSKQTLRKCIEELEDSGEWVVIRSKGRSRTRYYPMFVQGAKAELQVNVEEERLMRKTVDKQRKENAAAEAMDAQEFLTQTAATSTHLPEQPETAPLAVERSVSTPVGHSDPKVQTERDAAIRSAYLTAVQEKSFSDYSWDVSLPEVGQVVDVLTQEELKRVVNHGNPERIFVAGAEDVYGEELAGRWVAKFGTQFGPKFTYSYIQDTYDQLFAADFDGTNTHRIDAAMVVLGSLKKAPMFSFVHALVFTPFDGLDEPARELRKLIDATAAGRIETQKLSAKGFYRAGFIQESAEPVLTGSGLPDTSAGSSLGKVYGHSL